MIYDYRSSKGQKWWLTTIQREQRQLLPKKNQGTRFSSGEKAHQLDRECLRAAELNLVAKPFITPSPQPR